MEDLTALLLSPAPLWLVAARNGSSELLRFLIPLAHLLSFVVLTVLALMIRWPALRWVITVLLALYGGMREIAQSFLPPDGRMAGLVAGPGGHCCRRGVVPERSFAAGSLARLGLESRQPVTFRTSEREILETVLLRSAARWPSWWA